MMIGIDLGTTKACMAVIRAGRPEVILNQEGERTTPCVVAFLDEGAVPLVGTAAREAAVNRPERVIHGMQRYIGRRFDSKPVQDTRLQLPFPIVEGPSGEVRVPVAGRMYSPVEIQALVLRKLKDAAESALDEFAGDVVLTVPADFGYRQRQALQEAARLAGLRVVRFIHRATAAALAYWLDSARDQVVAVYDLGGGSFDVAILFMEDGLLQVRAADGAGLGGERFTDRIVEWFLSYAEDELGIDLRRDRFAYARVLETAEGAKRALSSSDRADLALSVDEVPGGGSRNVEALLMRRTYERLTADLLETTERICGRCLESAWMRPGQIDEVLLVGGQTRDPALDGALARVFGKPPNRALDPEQTGALGVAVQAGIIEGGITDRVLLEVVTHSIGIETGQGGFTPIIGRNSPIPTRKSGMFTALVGDDARLEVHVLQGESDGAAGNESLGILELAAFAPPPQSQFQVEVILEVDINGTLSVGGRLPDSSREWPLVVPEAGSPPGPALPSRSFFLVPGTGEFPGLEKAQREAHARVDALVASILRLVQTFESKLTPEELRDVLSAVEGAQHARKAGDFEVERVYLAELEKAAAALRQAMRRT